jgi:hypothetical protein
LPTPTDSTANNAIPAALPLGRHQTASALAAELPRLRPGHRVHNANVLFKPLFRACRVQITPENTKVVTERLGHSTTAYTQDAYQHVLPGMQRDAARRFRERLLSTDPERDGPDDESTNAGGTGA